MNSDLAERPTTALGYRCAQARPVEHGLNGVSDGRRESVTDSGSLSVVPKRSFIKFGSGLGIEPKPAGHPAEFFA